MRTKNQLETKSITKKKSKKVIKGHGLLKN